MLKWLLAVLITTSAIADTKISQLPLGTAGAVNTADSFPFVDSSTTTTKRLKISDLPSTPAFVSLVASKQDVLPLTIKGDILTRNNVALIRFPVCSDGFFMVADSSQASGWRCSPSGASTQTVTMSVSPSTLTSNYVLNVDTTGGNVSVQLPDAILSTGFFIDVKNLGINTVTINGRFGQTVDGSASKTITGQYDSLHIGAVNPNWFLY